MLDAVCPNNMIPLVLFTLTCCSQALFFLRSFTLKRSVAELVEVSSAEESLLYFDRGETLRKLRVTL